MPPYRFLIIVCLARIIYKEVMRQPNRITTQDNRVYYRGNDLDSGMSLAMSVPMKQRGRYSLCYRDGKFTEDRYTGDENPTGRWTNTVLPHDFYLTSPLTSEPGEPQCS